VFSLGFASIFSGIKAHDRKLRFVVHPIFDLIIEGPPDPVFGSEKQLEVHSVRAM
jgi:hypothetical protein